MNITIKCFASLSRFSPPDAEAFAIAPGETAADLVARLGIPPAELKLVFINGAHVELDAKLADGDRVGLFPAVGGG
jgi:molybdopterin converting factor small subunit